MAEKKGQQNGDRADGDEAPHATLSPALHSSRSASADAFSLF